MPLTLYRSSSDTSILNCGTDTFAYQHPAAPTLHEKSGLVRAFQGRVRVRCGAPSAQTANSSDDHHDLLWENRIGSVSGHCQCQFAVALQLVARRRQRALLPTGSVVRSMSMQLCPFVI